MLLLRQVDHPEVTFPEHAHQLVASDVAADLIEGLDSIQSPRGALILLSDMVIMLAHKNLHAISLRSGWRFYHRTACPGHIEKPNRSGEILSNESHTPWPGI